ncbi:MAG TPA: RDD family protein, partial [Burkholderiales bacterium]|nr:RDD family protein [Burkholderiales bacterium]
MAETTDAVMEPPVEDLDLGGSASVELEYAGFWSRVAALIVDNAVVTIFGLALLIAAGLIGEGAVVIANLLYIVIAILYWPLMESSERRATIGKQLLGIQVVDMSGAQLNFVRALLRNLAKIISSLPFGLGFLLAAFTAKKQALHDMITKCLVVRAGPSNFMKAVIATVAALLIMIVGGYYYVTEYYLPQMTEEMGRQMEKGMKQAQSRVPVAKPKPVQPPVAQAPAPAPAAQPAPAVPGGPKPMTPQEIAEFEKKMQQAKPEPAKVAAVTPPAKPGAPAKPAEATAKPAPAKPAPAPMAKEAPVKVAAAPAPKAKPETKPAAVAAAKPKPEPKAETKAVPLDVPKPKPVTAPVMAAPVAQAPERPATAPVPPAERPAPAPAPVMVAPGLSARVVRSPKYNDVMTCVMFHDAAALAELLELGWWVDRPDSNGVTPLMAAAWNGDAAMTQLLLKAGADPNRRALGGSVLEYAGRGENAQVIQLLRSSGAR